MEIGKNKEISELSYTSVLQNTSIEKTKRVPTPLRQLTDVVVGVAKPRSDLGSCEHFLADDILLVVCKELVDRHLAVVERCVLGYSPYSVRKDDWIGTKAFEESRDRDGTGNPRFRDILV
ncbi:MAG: hypothetical protein A2653_02480 [Candidatus Zambryskibacteria bacterium RIFCSPHIGHO2_01_FULL_43_25]|uniref:Uncharacterized protein n=1 Tax=Candidatus Zambryskibacteria bacterium RIFCSPLOWO2_01_FULL_45_21 TaxID=1802761 RepID=A0A1G2U2Y9_9BACT|nr:MAG: hypothetical protein A2653_02480 [Candidatus Zambryskibacteria bacterium RIFCSPHIGHO2_01_FULL_43_25]OHB01064.1 MAG: hypothetical protein A3E94_02660 [Candidatus Zambryskibacteria bacterium RIFCSPHIGHO2_12_FULL_44_12b]OHB03891.1 MAG: hypothetical protein A3B14_00970 [Candidatus Zambryskibacteria bacterium RIFCSPLOWO2_01_FULL_45_21]